MIFSPGWARLCSKIADGTSGDFIKKGRRIARVPLLETRDIRRPASYAASFAGFLVFPVFLMPD
jgi:hypothetical protein